MAPIHDALPLVFDGEDGKCEHAPYSKPDRALVRVISRSLLFDTACKCPFSRGNLTSTLSDLLPRAASAYVAVAPLVTLRVRGWRCCHFGYCCKVWNGCI
jgi:hypothetical protein